MVASGQKNCQAITNLIPNPTVLRENFILAAGMERWIIEADVDTFDAAEKQRTFLICVAAQSDNMFERLARILVKGFGAVVTDIYPDLLENFLGEWIDPSCLGSGRKSLKTLAKKMVDETFGHLRATGVVSTEK